MLAKLKRLPDNPLFLAALLGLSCGSVGFSLGTELQKKQTKRSISQTEEVLRVNRELGRLAMQAYRQKSSCQFRLEKALKRKKR